jgi:glucose/arabinose dehydrogenase
MTGGGRVGRSNVRGVRPTSLNSTLIEKGIDLNTRSWLRTLTIAVVAAGACRLTIRGASPQANKGAAAPAGNRAPEQAADIVAPPAIDWPSPPLPDAPFYSASAETAARRLHITPIKGLSHPWSLAFLPDGAILITERDGRFRIVRNGVLDPAPVAGAPKVQSGGRFQGLMDLALHPQFATNHFVYVAYHKAVPNGPPTNVVARGVWNGKAVVNLKDIFVAGDRDTEASRLAFGADGMLYMTIGAPGTGPHIGRAQDPNDYAGKLLRLTDAGAIPPDNPFVGKAGTKPAIFTLGHRNQLGLALNPVTGDLWASEMGPNGGDEVNIITAGQNYGWPVVSQGRDYMGPKISPTPYKEGMVMPVVVWVPSIATTGMAFYTNDRVPGWKNNLFVGGLREGEVPRTGQINRIIFNDRWEEIRREPMLRELHQRIRDVRVGPDGALYVLTDEDQGALLKIEPEPAPPAPPRR